MSDILSRTYEACVAVTKSDTVVDPLAPFAGLLVGTAGTVVFEDQYGNVTTTGSITAGTIIPVVTRMVHVATGATVFGLIANPYKKGVTAGT